MLPPNRKELRSDWRKLIGVFSFAGMPFEIAQANIQLFAQVLQNLKLKALSEILIGQPDEKIALLFSLTITLNLIA